MLKFSAAIREGINLYPRQAFECRHPSADSACAAESAILYAKSINESLCAEDMYPENCRCPVGCNRNVSIVHLNDFHRWSRELIADYYESLGY